ncbi:Periplasmic serine endoprotease DegP [Aquicella siphonis]|uniref:Periplasmic serine endoprotease DegP n=1 Tax=Aquicella siphonis TaxID=254247 RepID=A0A5E4PHV2_9COXI|nr:Do family serine endopeptidase [Aquicella siphonis]VVC76108.1 Periplasmic serine endoprotease DegP [Aquicella siphonis]
MKIVSRASLSMMIMLVSLIICTTGYSSIPVQNSLAPMLKTVLPSVVNIKADIKITDINTLRELQKQRSKNKDMDDQDPGSFVSVGSGVIVDAKNGYILTNAHVVADAQTVTITLSDGHHYTAKILGMDKPSDIALLQISAKNLSAIQMGNSNDLKVGDFVAAIGNPFGLNQTVTSGIVSALGRTTLGIENYENFIQTDAPINPGNSGGALINTQGQLVGINTAILAPDRGSIGIGFAIPANMAKSVMLQLLEYGNVKRGVLGIGAQDITPELASAFNINDAKGAAVTQILPNSPAEQAGVQVGDIITSINGAEIKSASDVVNTIGFLRVDSKVNLSVLRNNKPITINVTLSDSKKRKLLVAQKDPFLYGVGLKNFSVLSPVHGNVQAVLVASVERDSNSWHSDLRPGDVITSVNQHKINNIDELKTATAKSGKELLLNVLRGSSAIFLVINKES